MNRLRASGPIKSIRSVGEGYELAKKPTEITLGDILQAVEGSFDVVHCNEDDDCDRIEDCVMNRVWGDVKQAIENVVDSITLEDLVEKHNKLQQQISA